VRQTTLFGRKESAGQAVLRPSHCSAASQAPAAVRQTMPLGAGRSFGQLPSTDPAQVSAASQVPAAARQTSIAGRSAHDTVQHESPAPLAAPRSHASPASTTPLPHGTMSVALKK
jgi:hypothetical protein